MPCIVDSQYKKTLHILSACPWFACFLETISRLSPVHFFWFPRGYLICNLGAIVTLSCHSSKKTAFLLHSYLTMLIYSVSDLRKHMLQHIRFPIYDEHMLHHSIRKIETDIYTDNTLQKTFRLQWTITVYNLLIKPQ